MRNTPAAREEMRRQHPELGDHAEYHVGVELPDFPLARQWVQWLHTQPQQGLAGVLITPQEQWRDRPQELRRTLHALFREGRPALIWIGIWGVGAPRRA